MTFLATVAGNQSCEGCLTVWEAREGVSGGVGSIMSFS